MFGQYFGLTYSFWMTTVISDPIERNVKEMVYKSIVFNGISHKRWSIVLPCSFLAFQTPLSHCNPSFFHKPFISSLYEVYIKRFVEDVPAWGLLHILTHITYFFVVPCFSFVYFTLWNSFSNPTPLPLFRFCKNDENCYWF